MPGIKIFFTILLYDAFDLVNVGHMMGESEELTPLFGVISLAYFRIVDCQILIYHHDNLCTTSPERSFGSNHVAFGGIILPLSAMSIICFIDTGYNARAIRISPLSTRRFSSSRPRRPPTKSIRLSLLKSFMPRILSSMRRLDMSTSSTPIGSASSNVPGLATRLNQWPSR